MTKIFDQNGREIEPSLDANTTYKIIDGGATAYKCDYDSASWVAYKESILQTGTVFETISAEPEECDLLDGRETTVKGIIVSIDFEMYLLTEGDYTLEQVPGNDLF